MLTTFLLPGTAKLRRLKHFVAVLALLFSLDPELMLAQSLEDEVREENILESVLSYSDDVPEMFSRIDLNSASTEDLLSIPGMVPQFAHSIVEYRRKVKFIHSLDELSRLDGATPNLLSAARNRVQIFEENYARINTASYMSLSPQKVSLYYDAYGDGGIRNFQKLSAAYRNVEFYAVTDKDAGERNYLDFYSLAASIKNISVFSVVNVGDYGLSLGNGILFSRTVVVSKSAEPISPLFDRDAYSLSPYRSRTENGYLRGAAFAVPLGNFEFTGFASSKNFSARIDSSGSVTSIDYTGLNLPTSSGAGGDKLNEKIAGGIIRYDSPWAACGLSAVYFSYNHRFANYYLDKRLALDMFLRSQFDNVAFSGEMMADRVVSFSSNIKFDYDDAQFALGIRNLRSRIVPNYSGVLSESFPTSPEQGIYFGAAFHPVEIVKLGFYYDRFRIMSISGKPDRNGEEIFADSYITLSRQKIFEGTSTVIYLRYKYKTKEDFYVPTADFPVAQSTLAGSKQNFRIDFRHRFSPAFSVKLRLEKNFLSSGETGEMFLFDSGWRNERLSLNSSICFYNTHSFNSAFYGVENDLPGVAQFLLFYGDGARVSILANLKTNYSFSIGLKISRDIYNRDREVTAGSNSRFLPGVTNLSLELSYGLN